MTVGFSLVVQSTYLAQAGWRCVDARDLIERCSFSVVPLVCPMTYVSETLVCRTVILFPPVVDLLHFEFFLYPSLMYLIEGSVYVLHYKCLWWEMMENYHAVFCRDDSQTTGWNRVRGSAVSCILLFVGGRGLIFSYEEKIRITRSLVLVFVVEISLWWLLQGMFGLGKLLYGCILHCL